MAVFKILTCESVEPDASEFIVAFRSGMLARGDKFVCYMTHHPVAFVVTELASLGASVRLVCSGRIGYKDEFSNAVVNTQGKGVPAGFHFEH
jgi:hypothetical protein